MSTSLLTNMLRTAAIAAVLISPVAPARAQPYDIAYYHEFDALASPVCMIKAADGNYYGVTSGGGPNNRGTMFKVTPTGNVSTIHLFGESSGDGTGPTWLIQASDGNLYGTTVQGGVPSYGRGTVFKMTLAGNYSVLHTFGATNNDAYGPMGLTEASDGRLYGVSQSGGTHQGSNSYGTIFSVSKAGVPSIWHSFNNVDGAGPVAALTVGADGAMYGTTLLGGANNSGTLFKLVPGHTFSVLHHFAGAEGSYSQVPLLRASDGSLYGATIRGAAFSAGPGAIFKFDPTTLAVTTIGPSTSILSRMFQDGAGTIYTSDTTNVEAFTSAADLHTICTLAPGNHALFFTETRAGGVLYGVDRYAGSNVNGALFELGPGLVDPVAKLGVKVNTNQYPDVPESGVPLTATVTSLDSIDDLDTHLTGNVHLTSDDALAILPADFTLTNGTATVPLTIFTVTPGAPTLRSVTATSVSDGTITGADYVNFYATDLLLTVPATVTAGTPFDFSVSARTDFNSTHVATGYAGTVNFGTNAPSAHMPAASTLTNGGGTFSATLTAAGTSSANFKITAQDSRNSADAGTSTAITVLPAEASGFTVSTPSTAQDGTPFNVTVTAKDAYGNVATGYTGTVHITTSDPLAEPLYENLPNGVGTFSVTLHTSGAQTITVTDSATPTIHRTSTQIIVSSPATYMLVTSPRTVTTGTPFSFTVTARDRYNHRVGGYAGTVHFSSNTTHITLPPNSTLVHGIATFNATMTANVNCKITASDVATTSIRGTSVTITSGP